MSCSERFVTFIQTNQDLDIVMLKTVSFMIQIIVLIPLSITTLMNFYFKNYIQTIF